MDTSQALYPVNDCWNHIGVEGDRSCVELEKVIHCRNCPVYATAGRSLLERQPDSDYLKEWTAILATPGAQQSESFAQEIGFKVGRTGDTFSAIIFSLSNELFALSVGVLEEITHPCVIHTLPHRSNDTLLGLVNIRGEILLCASLTNVLGLETANPPSSRMKEHRMLVVGHGSKWVFPVDQVHRIHRFHTDELKTPPVVVAKANETYTAGVIDWHDKKVNYLDAELLFDTLARRIL